MSRSDSRSDIDAAYQRMRSKRGTRAEMQKLPGHLREGELVERMAAGMYGGGGVGLLVLTDRRLVFLKEGRMSRTSEDFPIEEISAVEWSRGIVQGKITIVLAGDRAEVGGVQRDDGEGMVEAVRARLAARDDAVRDAHKFFESLLDENGVLPHQQISPLSASVAEHDEVQSAAIWRALWAPMLLALAQGGQFLVERDTSLLLKDDERALYECPAYLLKEVTKRELRGASQGVSVPLGGGVRYRVGGIRGQMVELGSSWEDADDGRLTLTDSRLVYHGKRRTLEFRLDRLATLRVFGDAIAIGATNRQTNSHFRVATPEFVAGLIQGAVSHRDRIVVIHPQWIEANSLDDQRSEITGASASH